ncbi:MAG: hypothetical protein K6G11_09165 [Lachnospiraceae bacterium]|nr:hypothetical protein [Lachnospiraceae bacterium]
MNKKDIHQFRFTLNIQNKTDKELYEILKKQPNMSRYIKQAVLSYYNSEHITKDDLNRLGNRIIRELEDCLIRKSEKQEDDQSADSPKDKTISSIKNLF